MAQTTEPEQVDDRVKAIVKEAVQSIKQSVGKYRSTTQDQIRQAMKDKSIDRKQLVGKVFYAEEPDSDYPMFGQTERLANGRMTMRTVSIDHVDKTFSDSTEECVWFLMGRLYVETGFGEDGGKEFNLLILDEVDENHTRSRLIDDEIAPFTWEVLEDQTRPIEMPSKPEGYRVVDPW
ncbi:MAG: hypothetical protein AAF664_21500 [Planctomycetota bacterium]